jgi:hypothetical protein
MKWCLLICWLALAAPSGSDTYYVSHVKGEVRRAGAKSVLKLGEELKLTDSLKFGSPSDLVAVINPKRGRFVIKAGNNQAPVSKAPGLIVLISENLIPGNETKIMGSRFGGAEDLPALRNYLLLYGSENGYRFALLDSFRLVLGGDLLKNQGNNFFYLQYLYKGEEINKRLRISKQADEHFLVFDRDIFKIDGKMVEPPALTEARLFYYEAASDSSRPVSRLLISSETTSTLEAELAVLRPALREFFSGHNPSDSLVRRQLYSHIYENYGVVDRNYFQLFGIK